jgi:predicted transcriptional regulator of viral defense system
MTYRKQLRELAFDRHGVVTTAAAVAAGVPAVEVRKLAGRGALYRMLEVPAGPLDEYAEAVALAGPDALLADEAVLAVHGLAQVNLRRIRVASPHRVRARLPPTVELVHRNVPAGQRDYVDGIPAMSLEAALVACRGRIMTERLIDATRAAAARGLLVPRAKTRVLAALSGMNDSRPANRYG